jgi:hypothetical protein
VFAAAQVGLQHCARAMDIHKFLTYRLRNHLSHPVLLSTKALQSVFGQEVTEPWAFWQQFKKALHQALSWYPQARVELLEDGSGMKLFNSPPLIQHRSQGWCA